MRKRNILALMTVLSLVSFPLTACERETTEVETRTTTTEQGTGTTSVDTNTGTNENEEIATTEGRNQAGTVDNKTGDDNSYQVAHNGVDHSKEDPMMKSMMKSMDKMKVMPMTGHNDQDFAMMMIEHHKGAIDMAKAEISHGKNAELKKMSEDIIKKQEKEIKDMQAFVDKFKAGHKDATAHKVNMNDPFNKMMTASMKMDNMHKHAKTDVDHSFLENMIKHHQQGIDMAKAELAHGKDASMKKMAQQIIADQQKEIKTMQAMLNKK
jgi:uncharacterized protein (DUF305 family)